MTEQDLADRLSEQVDRLLQGSTPNIVPEGEELADLLNLGERLSQTQFQAAPIAQAAFLSQLASWFGLTNGGPAMTILGLSKTWFISICITIIALVTGAGLIAVIVTRAVIFGPISAASDTPTPTVTEIAPGTVMTPTLTATPTLTGSVTITTTPTVTTTPVAANPITIIFQRELTLVQLCQGVYSTQTTLVNYGSQPISEVDLMWDIIEGDDLVEAIDLAPEDDNADESATSATLVSNDPAFVPNFATFDSIATGQNLKIDVKVKVKDKWWDQPDGTEVKIKLKVKSKNRTANSNQIITVVKQGSEWITLTGFAHPYDDDSLLIDGNIVLLTDCTGQPVDLPTGSGVEVIVTPQGDGTFVAVIINIIDIDIIIVNFDSGKGPETGGGGSNHGGSGGGSDDDDDGDHDRGHGNDPDRYDEDNPGRSGDNDDDD